MDIQANLTSDETWFNRLFPLQPADFTRNWMDEFDAGFAYRCLPLKIANEAGWVMRCPTNFTATYITDKSVKNSVQIAFDNPKDIHQRFIHSHFGRGIITINLPYLITTESPWCVWARGYPNYHKENVQFLEGITETYWAHATFTYNMRILKKQKPVRFEEGDPLMFLTTVNLQELNKTTMQYTRLSSKPELKKKYEEWHASRINFNDNKDRTIEDWQKQYFKGLKPDDSLESGHITVMKLKVDYGG